MLVTCSICEEYFTGVDTEVVKSTKCGHIFHGVCLDKWLKRSKSCPQCRNVVMADTIRLYFQVATETGEDEATNLRKEIQKLSNELADKDEIIMQKNDELKSLKAEAGMDTDDDVSNVSMYDLDDVSLDSNDPDVNYSMDGLDNLEDPDYGDEDSDMTDYIDAEIARLDAMEGSGTDLTESGRDSDTDSDW